MPRVQRPQVHSAEDLPHAPRRKVERQLQFELERVLRNQDLTQEGLATLLGLDSQASVSKWINGHTRLSRPRAAMLDEKVGPTSLGVPWVDLVDMLYRVRGDQGRHAEHGATSSAASVFLASPMASVGAGYSKMRQLTNDVASVIETFCDRTVYYAGRDIERSDEFDPSDLAATENFRALMHADFFVLLVPQPLSKPSSIFVEAGYALAAGKPSLYIVSDAAALPYALRTLPTHEAERSVLPAVLIERVKNGAAAAALLKNHGRILFDRLEDRDTART